MKKPPIEAVFLGSERAARQLLKPAESLLTVAANAVFFPEVRTVKGHAGRCGQAGSGLPASAP
jgi:hypothetical protein